jgi:hypothetical protein
VEDVDIVRKKTSPVFLYFNSENKIPKKKGFQIQQPNNTVLIDSFNAD